MDAPAVPVEELTEFPLPEVPDVVQYVVAEKCEIGDLLRLYVASHFSENLVKATKIIPKEVRIGADTLDVTLSNNSRLSWQFEPSLNQTLANFTFRNLVKTAEKDGSFWKTTCKDWTRAKQTVFMHFKQIFKFDDIEFLEFCNYEGDVRQDYILNNIGRCRNMSLKIDSTIRECQFDWLLDKFIPGGQLTIRKHHSLPFLYQKDLPACKSLSLDFFSPPWFNSEQAFATTITHIHLFHFDFDDSDMLNELFREWKAGSFPNLQILERGERAREVYTEEKLYRNLDVRIWRQRREQEININRFFYYTKVMHIYRNLCFARARDISHNDKWLEASIIPTPSFPDDRFVSFVFVVWGDFVPPVQKEPVKEGESAEQAGSAESAEPAPEALNPIQ